MYESTLQYRDAEHGGLPYYINNAGEKIALPDHQAQAPNGGKAYHDGVVLPVLQWPEKRTPRSLMRPIII